MIRELISTAWHRMAGGDETRAITEADIMKGLIDDLGSANTAAGVRVNYNNVLNIGAVWQCVEQISGDIAKLPLDLFKKENGSRLKDENHPAYDICRHEANEENSAFDFWRTMLVHALIYNNAYAYILRANNGTPLEIIPLLPDRTFPLRYNKRLYFQTIVLGDRETPSPHTMEQADVFHLKGISFDGMSGIDKLRHMKESIGVALAAQGFAASYFANGMQAGGVIELPPHVARDEKAVKNIEQGFIKKNTGQGNWFKWAILRDGVKFNKITMSPNEGQMLETSERQVRDAARYFNLAPSRLGLSDSVSYNSKEESNQQYLDTTLSPWMTGITSECRRKLLKPHEKKGRYFEFNTRAILSMSPLKRAQVQAIQIRNGIINPNEAREAENLNPRQGGDEFIEINKTKSPGGADKGENDKPRGAADDSPDETPDNEQQDPQGDEEQNRAEAAEQAARRAAATTALRRRVVFGITARARHKAQRGGNAFLEWSDGNLQQHRQEAQQLLGSDEFIDPIAARMAEIVNNTGTQDLLHVVDQVAAEIETEF